MAFILSYTKKGEGFYDASNYPGHDKAYNCDWEHAMHLAISDDGVVFEALRNNTGILFPKADFPEGRPAGVTKTLLSPWIFRDREGSFLVAAVRRNQNAPDPLSKGSVMLFSSEDLVHYKEAGFLSLSPDEIRDPRCRYEADRGRYYLEWTTDKGLFSGFTDCFDNVYDVQTVHASTFPAPDAHGVPEAVPGNIIEVSDEEARVIRGYFGVIRNTGVRPAAMEVFAGSAPDFETLPDAVLLYSDGSEHTKKVSWDRAVFDNIDFSHPGNHEIPGEIRSRSWTFPIPIAHEHREVDPVRPDGFMSDPCMIEHNGKYYLTSSGRVPILLRISDTPEGVFDEEPVMIPVRYDTVDDHLETWAPELHFIEDRPYIFTTAGDVAGHEVNSVVLSCNGEADDPSAWDPVPHFCVRPDGKRLIENGVSLDMTCFGDGGRYYVMWSQRREYDPADDIGSIPEAEPADVYIAAVDPKAPWQLLTEPVCVVRPSYGWDRFETPVDEGPYALFHGDDIFVSISGSSTSLADLYDVGFLRAKSGADLCDAASWEWITYPFLTKESVPNEFGPGHNSFVKDLRTGDDLIIYHAVPHDENGKTLGRKPGIRRVHWAATGLPYLEMTGERDLDPEFKYVTLKITVRQ